MTTPAVLLFFGFCFLPHLPPFLNYHIADRLETVKGNLVEGKSHRVEAVEVRLRMGYYDDRWCDGDGLSMMCPRWEMI